MTTLNARYDRIEAEPLHPVWLSLVPRADAIRREQEAEGKSLAGLTFAIKDNIDYRGLPTTAACPEFAYQPASTAPVVRALEDAGAIAIGKTNMDQFATGLVGTRSPHGACSSVYDARYISGGSSSGSAVAVAKGLVDFSLGTDTAGSGRVPAAFNHLVGLKPTRGLLSTSGVMPACRTLDCVSIFARTVAVARHVFQAAAKFDAADPYSRAYRPCAAPWLNSPGMRFGVPPASQLEFFGDGEAAKLYDAAIARMTQQLGAEPVEIDFRIFRQAADLLYSGPWVAERLAVIEPFARDHADAMHPVVRGIITGAARYTAVDTFRSQYRLQELMRLAAAEWERIGFLLLPTTGTTYTIEEVERDPVALNTNLGFYTNFVNLMDLAAIAVPAGFRPNGLPFGVSLIGPAFSDEALLTVAERFLGETVPVSSGAPGCVTVAVVGAHLRGQPLNWQLTDRGARYLATRRTASNYRLYALRGTHPPKPGLELDPSYEGGPGVEVELWSCPETEFGGFVAAIPAPLGIGTAVLDDGTEVKCFIAEPHALRSADEITTFGGWRNYLSSRKGA